MFLTLVIGLTLNSCIPLPTEQGVCKTSEGDVNTHQIFGVWKKVPNTVVEQNEFSADTYRLLYISRGNARGQSVSGGFLDDGNLRLRIQYSHAICFKRVNADTEDIPLEGGLYYLDSPRKRIRTNMIVGLDPEESGGQDQVEEWAEYSFSGSCGKTRLTLTRGSKVDTYTFFATEPPNSVCDFGTDLEE
jgi:hypothetical protein